MGRNHLRAGDGAGHASGQKIPGSTTRCPCLGDVLTRQPGGLAGAMAEAMRLWQERHPGPEPPKPSSDNHGKAPKLPPGKLPNIYQPSPPLNHERSARLVANLEKVQRMLNPQEPVDYDQARHVVAQDTAERSSLGALKPSCLTMQIPAIFVALTLKMKPPKFWPNMASTIAR